MDDETISGSLGQVRTPITQLFKLPAATQVLPSAELTLVSVIVCKPEVVPNLSFRSSSGKRLKVQSCEVKGSRKRKNKLFINHDITPMHSKISKVPRDSWDIKYVNFLNEKRTICYENKEKVTYNNLFELHKSAPSEVFQFANENQIFSKGFP